MSAKSEMSNILLKTAQALEVARQRRVQALLRYERARTQIEIALAAIRNSQECAEEASRF